MTRVLYLVTARTQRKGGQQGAGLKERVSRVLYLVTTRTHRKGANRGLDLKDSFSGKAFKLKKKTYLKNPLGTLKWQCHEIVWHYFISWIETLWVPDKQYLPIKWFRWKIRFHKDIREKRDSAQCDTAPSLTPHSVILCRVRLRAVWYCAQPGNWNVRKSKIGQHYAESDSARNNTAQSPTPRSVSLDRAKHLFFSFRNFNFQDLPVPV